jgi:hypothetical protein
MTTLKNKLVEVAVLCVATLGMVAGVGGVVVCFVSFVGF